MFGVPVWYLTDMEYAENQKGIRQLKYAEKSMQYCDSETRAY